jgi:metallo-beta-lactamase family protein
MANASDIQVTFCGAARTVTGSMHLVEFSGLRLLLDCGLFQGPRQAARERNLRFPFSPAEIDVVVLSHAHIDHCGNLPNLVRQGFRGPIYCTPATRDLVAVMLADSAKIQEEDAAFLNSRPEHRGKPVVPLYGRDDVYPTVRACHGVPYDRPCSIAAGVELRLIEAGHVLGSAQVCLHLDGAGSSRTIVFTGDLGRRGQPILRDPAPVPKCDLLICESTYGSRHHPPITSLADDLQRVVKRTFDRGGKIVIPAFSLGRTQTIVYYLHQLMDAGRLPGLPVFVDSPLAADATQVFRLHPECFDQDTIHLLEDDPDVFGQKRVHYVRSVEESKSLNSRKDPCIIIAASGMCESGRIVHHLRHTIEDSQNTIVIVGYQAPGTLGRRLVEHQPQVMIHDRLWKLRAEVVVLNGFSSHADQTELLEDLAPLAADTRLVRLVHGEPAEAEALSTALTGAGFRDVAVPAPGDTVALC